MVRADCIQLVPLTRREDAAVEAALRECVRAGGLDCAVSAIGPYLVTRK